MAQWELKMAATGWMKALERRLVRNDLTAEDKVELTRVQRLYRLRKEGATYSEIARTVGEPQKNVEAFMSRGAYKLFVDYIHRLEAGDDERQAEQFVKTAKQQFAQFGTDAIDFYRVCFRRDGMNEFENQALAQWATEKVSKGLGLTEPDHIVRPVVNIAHAVIVAESRQVDEEDALARASVRVIDVTPTQLPAPQTD